MEKNHDSLSDQRKEQKRKMLKSIKATFDSKRTFTERAADWMTSRFGSMTFLVLNVAVFVLWLLVNTGSIKALPVFDPFPFNFLTMVVSLEAIILAIFVLISQNRNAKIDDLREETHLQVNLISEREITKLMKMLEILLEKEGVGLSKDPELKELLKPISEEEIEKKLEKEIF